MPKSANPANPRARKPTLSPLRGLFNQLQEMAFPSPYLLPSDITKRFKKTIQSKACHSEVLRNWLRLRSSGHLPRLAMEVGKNIQLHPRKLTWNLKITCLKRKIIFQTSIFRFHVSFPGCKVSGRGFMDDLFKGAFGYEGED